MFGVCGQARGEKQPPECELAFLLTWQVELGIDGVSGVGGPSYPSMARSVSKMGPLVASGGQRIGRRSGSVMERWGGPSAAHAVRPTPNTRKPFRPRALPRQVLRGRERCIQHWSSEGWSSRVSKNRRRFPFP